jgi:hypothetical protein
MATLPPNKFKELYEGGFSDAWIVEKAGSGKTASAEYAGVCPGCKGGKLYLRQDSDAAQCAHCGVMITATDLALLNSKARPAPLRIHVLHQGSPLCHFTSGRPVDWPKGHEWVSLDAFKQHASITCYDCAEAARHILEPGP